ncbi:transcriptional regulator [Sphaerochaeta pleomorpha str. Grapes]|uniref:Transcriptional regulator n=1 Tax=Sphaerochaeta pleomorpha (strain ATCC BAA-1885 / DSM 22778 / Grapes) TaxID=158190 RepID=G8QV14_SPHPG|nr:MurR/RpiR family transcriptional regulator [Sphaerochaeta pleomorpha]AEV29250.1 transcriptional regulator [Sphaerochaeta pleomorpha str. Grapes]
MTEVSAIYTIKNKYASLSAKERKIADFILEHPLDSVNPSIEELADSIGISESTMVRFAKKLGYSGYQRFRIALARETVPSNAQVFETEVNDSEDVIDTVFRNAQKTCEATYRNIDRDALKKAANMIVSCEKLYIAGLGGSNIIAQDAYHKFIRTGISCNYNSEYHMQLMLASQARKQDVAFIISNTGVNTDTLALAEEYRNNGCPIIVLTSNSRSPLARMGNTVLNVTLSANSMVAESFSARTVSMVIIDVLYVEILEQLKDQGIENLNNMRSVIARRRI